MKVRSLKPLFNRSSASWDGIRPRCVGKGSSTAVAGRKLIKKFTISRELSLQSTEVFMKSLAGNAIGEEVILQIPVAEGSLMIAASPCWMGSHAQISSMRLTRCVERSKCLSVGSQVYITGKISALSLYPPNRNLPPSETHFQTPGTTLHQSCSIHSTLSSHIDSNNSTKP